MSEISKLVKLLIFFSNSVNELFDGGLKEIGEKPQRKMLFDIISYMIFSCIPDMGPYRAVWVDG